MDETDTTPAAPRPDPRTVADNARRALERSRRAGKDVALRALDSYVANPRPLTLDMLAISLQTVLGDRAANAAMGMTPPRPGLVWCCDRLGWVTPAERFDHRWDAYSGMTD
jgi:hypothetical protein